MRTSAIHRYILQSKREENRIKRRILHMGCTIPTKVDYDLVIEMLTGVLEGSLRLNRAFQGKKNPTKSHLCKNVPEKLTWGEERVWIFGDFGDSVSLEFNFS